MKPLKIAVGITLDQEIVTEIKKLAEKDDRSFSQYINLVLRNHIENDGYIKPLKKPNN